MELPSELALVVASTLWPTTSECLSKDVGVTVIDGPRVLEQSDVAKLKVTQAEHSCAVFHKCISLPALRARWKKSDAKWRINLASFESEISFYSRLLHNPAARGSLLQSGIWVPRPLAIESPGESVPEFERIFHLVLELIPTDRWKELSELDFPHAAVLLHGLAGFHAAHWVADASSPVSGSRFARGGWWRPELRPGLVYENAPAVYRALRAAFPADFAAHDEVAVAASVARLVSPEGLAWLREQTWPQPGDSGGCTLLHGDCKTSNILFPPGSSAAVAAAATTADFHPAAAALQTLETPSSGEALPPAPAPSLAMIDFQWSAAGRTGCADVAYAMCGAVHWEALAGGAAEAPHGCPPDASDAGGAAGDELKRCSDSDSEFSCLSGLMPGEAALLRQYFTCVRAALAARNEKFGCAASVAAVAEDACGGAGSAAAATAPSCVSTIAVPDVATLWRQYRCEFALYVATALPHLMTGMTPELAEENKLKYGFLTHERDPRIMAWMCERAAQFVNELMPAAAVMAPA